MHTCLVRQGFCVSEAYIRESLYFWGAYIRDFTVFRVVIDTGPWDIVGINSNTLYCYLLVPFMEQFLEF